MSAKTYNSRLADKFVLRLLDGMRQEIKAISETTHRSMNSEIISWIEMILEIHKQTGVIPNLDSLRSTAQLEAQNRVMRALFLRLLEAGSWHYSAVEFEHNVNGEKFEEEIKEVLATAKPVNVQGLPKLEVSDINCMTFEKLEAAIKALPRAYGPDLLPPKRQFIAQEGMPVYVSTSRRNGIVRHMWIGGSLAHQRVMARVEMQGGGCVEVQATDLEAPKP